MCKVCIHSDRYIGDKPLEAIKVILTRDRNRGTVQLDIEELINLENIVSEIEATK